MLEIKDLCFKYKKNAPNILNDFTYTFENGKLYGIMGRSGTGKTTLISLVAGLEKPNSGEIYLDGKSIAGMDMNEYRSKQTGVIFQSFNLLLKFNAIENVEMELYLSGRRKDMRKTALSLLGQLGIEGATARRRILHLSGGEQQRVAIARALAGDPKIIIADEPTGNLDYENTDNIMNILKNLSREGKCVIVVTHSDNVSKYADELIKL